MAGFFDTLFGGGAEKDAANANRALYQDYLTKGTGYLDSGLNNSLGALNTAKGEYSSLSPTYNSALTMLGNAYGLNGASGNAAASSAFTTSPGYQQGIDAGIDVLNRRRAAGGMLNSGNADIDALTFGQNQQNQQYNNWLSGLTGLSNNALSVANSLAGIDTNTANLYQSDATNRVGLQGNVTSGDANANVLQAQGEAAGAKNLLGAGLGVASLAMGGGGLGGLGSMFGSGGAGSALGSLGLTYGTPGAAGSNLYGPLAPR